MAGQKGMKWSKERPPKKVPCTVALRPYLYYKVQQLGRVKRWSISTSIEYIIEEFYKSEYYKEKGEEFEKEDNK